MCDGDGEYESAGIVLSPYFTSVFVLCELKLEFQASVTL